VPVTFANSTLAACHSENFLEALQHVRRGFIFPSTDENSVRLDAYFDLFSF
jgi:hypothetical protein